MPRRPTGARVAASSTWTDPDGVRMPAGDVHGWLPGTNQTVCGIPLSRASLARFPHVAWPDVDPATGAHADAVGHVCPRCRGALRPREGRERRSVPRRP
ncbi:hypothetical protein [Cellulomonas fimi]|uniref:Uncharacterized protein n=1 Tax=Cellulomonas fimi (strain ATCC 484 / DSM 20113 / JCM 1341 / CCUG 24087 / LMG 16345 / NBRC 15513 / NCIMB 8980 / NCTC 7547 / NRS-133) TaxID=590998 RepID=F4GYW6_CELFA|nr:hypothetical protein [Cellulomonas fimi]AEE45956.1 hypothetical protein Celf_1826 [Cellulomonas fimi ATCC 484]NNH06542.1 hypothetical protein [Cellulomonas fimi]VEH31110.1 Uncharacterised protein [Cellulomonas fimi]